MQQDKSARIHYLDAMRGILMILGIVIHAAQIYSPEAVLKVVNSDTSIIMQYIVSSIHLFRMPAFFVVSGFFCYLTLKKYGVSKFLKLRLARIAIPLVTTIFTLNIAMHYVMTETGWSQLSLSGFFNTGRYINHLWFLVDLIYFFLVTALLHQWRVLQKVVNKVASMRIFKTVPFWWLIFALPFVTLGIMFLNKLGVPIYTRKYGLFAPYSLLYNYIFFIFGYAISIRREIYQSFTELNPLCSGLILIAALYVPFTLLPEQFGLFTVIAKEYGYLLAQWCSISLCFYFFSKFLPNHSEISRRLSDASYTIYLFHFLVLILLSIIFIKVNPPAFIGFLTTCICVFAITYFLHRKVILKVRTLLYLYNGK